MTRTTLGSICGVLALLAAQPALSQEAGQRLELSQGWTLQSSTKVHGSAESISSLGYAAPGWIAAEIPTTVVAAQVKAGLLPTPTSE